MPATDTECEDALPEDPEKRESLKTMAAAAMGVALFTDSSWWPFGDDDGLGEALRILNDGEDVDVGVEELDFGNSVSVTTTDTGVRIDVKQDFTGDVTTDSDVGIGTRSPSGIADGFFSPGDVRLAVSGSGDQRIVGEAYGDSMDDAVQFYGVGARGSTSSPAAVQDQDLLVNFAGAAHDGSDFLGVGGLQMRVDGAVSTGVVPTQTRCSLVDSSGNAFLATQRHADGTFSVDNGALQSLAGGATYDNGAVELGGNGARLEVNGSGEIVAVDEAGNETTIS